jgi:homoaconitase/3-isopropylmalate dehydratase large subunit
VVLSSLKGASKRAVLLLLLLLLLHKVSLPTISFPASTEQKQQIKCNTGLNTLDRSSAHLDKHFVGSTTKARILPLDSLEIVVA